MPRDGSGNYGLPSGNPVVTNTIISSTWANSTLNDVAAALTQSLSRDGQTTPTANLSMGNFRLMALANAQTRTDAANAGQVQDNSFVILSSVAGTGDAITAATSPAISTYVAGAKFVYTPIASNTIGAPTINIAGLGAKTIVQSNGQALWAGALAVGTPYEIYFDGTNFRVQTGQIANAIVQMGSPFALRNRIIDGNFDFWSVGTSFPLTGNNSSYTADMWSCSGGAGATCIFSRQQFALGGDNPLMESPASFFMQMQVTASSSSNPGIAQHIESVRIFSGRSATLSMWLWCASGTVVVQPYINQVFGTGGSPSSSVLTNAPQTWTVTTTPTRFSTRIDVPSVSGKTLGTAGDYLQVGLILPNSALYTVSTTQWQFEDCPTGAPINGLPTPYEWRGQSTEKSMIARYFEKLGGTAQFDILFQGYAAGVVNVNQLISYTAKKRAIPAVSLVGTWTTLNVTGFSAIGLGVDNIDLAAQSAATGAVGWNTVNTTTYLLADARL